MPPHVDSDFIYAPSAPGIPEGPSPVPTGLREGLPTPPPEFGQIPGGGGRDDELANTSSYALYL